jgi:hypothetical protein
MGHPLPGGQLLRSALRLMDVSEPRCREGHRSCALIKAGDEAREPDALLTAIVKARESTDDIWLGRTGNTQIDSETQRPVQTWGSPLQDLRFSNTAKYHRRDRTGWLGM